MTATANKPRVLLGLIGAGIQQTLSPALHEAEGDAQGLRIQYRIYDLDVLQLGDRALPALLDAARLLGYAGSTSRSRASRPCCRCSTRCPTTRAR
jgi:shikimate 5-dehydrogenase